MVYPFRFLLVKLWSHLTRLNVLRINFPSIASRIRSAFRTLSRRFAFHLRQTNYQPVDKWAAIKANLFVRAEPDCKILRFVQVLHQKVNNVGGFIQIYWSQQTLMIETRFTHEREMTSRKVSALTAVDEICVCKTRCLFYGWIIFLSEETFLHISTPRW